jgi:hypothetical protein
MPHPVAGKHVTSHWPGCCSHSSKRPSLPRGLTGYPIRPLEDVDRGLELTKVTSGAYQEGMGASQFAALSWIHMHACSMATWLYVVI